MSNYFLQVIDFGVIFFYESFVFINHFPIFRRERRNNKIKCVYDNNVINPFTFEHDTEILDKVNKFNKESIRDTNGKRGLKHPSFLMDGEFEPIYTAERDGTKRRDSPYISLGKGLEVTKNKIYFEISSFSKYEINITSGSGFSTHIMIEKGKKKFFFQCDKWDGQKKF